MKKILKKIASIVCCTMLTIGFVTSNADYASAASVTQEIKGTISASNMHITKKPTATLHTYDKNGKHVGSYSMTVKTNTKNGIYYSYTISISKRLDNTKVSTVCVQLNSYSPMGDLNKKYSVRKALKKGTYKLGITSTYIPTIN